MRIKEEDLKQKISEEFKKKKLPKPSQTLLTMLARFLKCFCSEESLEKEHSPIPYLVDIYDYAYYKGKISETDEIIEHLKMLNSVVEKLKTHNKKKVKEGIINEAKIH